MRRSAVITALLGLALVVAVSMAPRPSSAIDGQQAGRSVEEAAPDPVPKAPENPSPEAGPDPAEQGPRQVPRLVQQREDYLQEACGVSWIRGEVALTEEQEDCLWALIPETDNVDLKWAAIFRLMRLLEHEEDHEGFTVLRELMPDGAGPPPAYVAYRDVIEQIPGRDAALGVMLHLTEGTSREDYSKAQLAVLDSLYLGLGGFGCWRVGDGVWCLR